MTERELFMAALDLPDPAAQAAYLDQACGGNDELRGRVEGLLRAHAEASTFLKSPAAVPADPDRRETIAMGPTPERDSDDDPLTFLSKSNRPDSLGRIGHYEVLQALGRGGFGIVFRAFDDVLQRVVAVKVLAPEVAATSPVRKRFLREARSSAQVRHENVVQVYAVEEQPLPYIVMEFIPGETLQQRLDRTGPLEVPEILRIGRQLAEGLAAAHATDLIHRDIKPGNVLLEGGQQRVKITDFGLARAADDASISQSGLIAGTPMYMAPEQALGQTLDQRADLFSLGSVLYQMTSGRPPFRANNTLAVLKRVTEDHPRPIREIIPEAPRWLCDVIAKLHCKNPVDRYQSAREVADVLADCEEQLKTNSKVRNLGLIPGAAKPRGWLKRAATELPYMFLGLGVAATALALAFFGYVAIWEAWHAKPPGAAQAHAEQAKPPAAKELAPPVPGADYVSRSTGMKFKFIKAGTGVFGEDAGQKEITIPEPFLLGMYTVTQAQWEKVMGTTPWKGQEYVKEGANIPATYVSWEDANAFCKKLGEKDGVTYRLPTEHEWEYACRAGTKTKYSFGDDESDLGDYAWFDKNALAIGQQYVHEVGMKKPNPFGLYDMHGNVWQFTSSARAGSRLVNRGGSWRHSAASCRSADRGWFSPGDRADFLGFRVVALNELAAPPPAAIAPFDAAQAKAHQEAWAKRLGVPVEHTNSLGMKLMLIPPGEFTMGTSAAEIARLTATAEVKEDAWLTELVSAEGPERRVVVDQPFYLAAHETTVGQMRAFVGATGYRTTAETTGGGLIWNFRAKKWEQLPENVWKTPTFSRSDSHPVGFLTLPDAQAFCRWLSAKEGREYSVPAEEQWEFACRAGSTTAWSFGADAAAMKDHGWLLPHSGGVHHPVGRLAANPFGLHDLYGNAVELAAAANGAAAERGGSAGLTPLRARSAFRWTLDKPMETVESRGFRVAMSVEAAKAEAEPKAKK